MKKEKFIEPFSHFVTRFDCTCNQIKSFGKGLLDDIRYSYKISNHYAHDAHGKRVVIGWQYPDNTYFIPEIYDPRHRVRDGFIHPLSYLLVGSKAVNRDPNTDADIKFHLPYETVSCFLQGFINKIEYKDCWGGGNPSVAFNVGRYMLHKHLNSRLQYLIQGEMKDLLPPL